jgi:aerobic-type carbon monoxide dehydrogenase small subunit (CoxS/CutS family)
MLAADEINFTVNGKERAITSAPDRSLLDVLREDLQISGPKYGCGEGACGACSVLIDNKRVFSCSTPVREVAGKSIMTIEGIALGDQLSPVQQAFLDEKAFQCGYCTAGMIVAAEALLRGKPNPSDAQIVEAMNGNICRCCTYPRIIAAVKRAGGKAEATNRTNGHE